MDGQTAAFKLLTSAAMRIDAGEDMTDFQWNQSGKLVTFSVKGYQPDDRVVCCIDKLKGADLKQNLEKNIGADDWLLFTTNFKEEKRRKLFVVKKFAGGG